MTQARVTLFLGYFLVGAMVLNTVPTALEAQILVRKPIYNDPLIYVINKSVTNSWCNKDIYCQVYSSSLAYIASFYSTPFGIQIGVDPCWNRLVYTDHVGSETPRMREYGTFGYGVGNYNEPMAVKVVSLTSDEVWDDPYYWIYVADRGNNRVQQLRYDWTTPAIGLIHSRYFTTDLYRPTDLDYSVGLTFDNPLDDVLWVACKSDKIVAFWPWNGQKILSYGTTGSGTGNFSDIRAVVCGKNLKTLVDGDEVWFANNNYVYVIDAGNSRIVRLSYSPDFLTIQWDLAISLPDLPFTDLEVDPAGHIWATAEMGRIFKFTKDLAVLGTFGSEGTGPNQFDYPVSIASPGGHMGCGEMVICENWTDQSGEQLYAIGTDVNDIYVNTAIVSGTCYSYISFLLADYSMVTINIKDSAGTSVIKQLKNNIEYPSGIAAETWNGRNSSNQLVPWGTYRVEITATSKYMSRTTGQPVNSATKSSLFTLCGGACTWLVGDSNGNGEINISDAIHLIAYIFAGGNPPYPHPVGSGDANCSRSVNISDAVYLINYIFASGPAPGLTCSCADYLKK